MKNRFLTGIFLIISLIVIFPGGCKNKEKETKVDTSPKSAVAREPLQNSESKARISFDELTYDFGEVDEGEKVIHVFKFKNVGDEKLVISNVRSSCGCTAALLSSKEIMPGKMGEIKATFNSSRFKGRVTKTITVESNDPKNSSIKLKITGTVTPEIFVKPAYINFGEIFKGDSVTKSITISFKSDSKLKIKKIETSLDGISYKILSKDTSDSGGTTIEVSFIETKKIGRVSGTLKILTNSKKKPEIEVPLYATIKGSLEVTPHTLSFGLVNTNSTNTLSLTVAVADKKAKEGTLEITGVKDSNDFIEFEIRPLFKGLKYEINAILKPNLKPGSFRGKLTIATNDPDQETIEVPYFGTVRK